MNEKLRPLEGLMVNLSISENEDTDGLGFPKWQLNRATLQIVSALFSQGAGVVFGHDWRDDGVMEAVHSFALQMQAADPESTPLLWNVLPWPDEPRLSAAEQERLSATLRILPGELPEDVLRYGPEALVSGPESTIYKEVRARGLTHLRQRLTNLSKARICLGGRTRGHAGRMPGVYEEALIAIQAGMPLYLAGLFGGATRLVIDAIEGPRPEEPLPEWDYIRKNAPKSLEANGLTWDDNRRLFHTPIIDEAITFILSGLSRARFPN